MEIGSEHASGTRDTKGLVHDFWNSASCGEALYLKTVDRQGYLAQAEERYRLEPYIERFAGFEASSGKQVLEIGVGLGADHQRFAENGALLQGVDLTERAIAHTRRRMSMLGLESTLKVADAENLPFEANSFDIVYSWGVLHHSPDTPRAINEVLRVLKPGGVAKIMMYNKWSMVGVMLWTRYALLVGRPWRSMSDVYHDHLESPGTKAFTVSRAEHLMREYEDVRIEIELSHGDLLESNAGQRHQGALLSMARRIWPRKAIRRWLPGWGLFMLISARKPMSPGGAGCELPSAGRSPGSA